MKKAMLYSSMGGVLEFYDFIIFAIFATAISKTFFPSANLIAGLLFTFSVFAAGYFSRPLGGIIFGHFGDKYGRKKTFTCSVIIMALSTLVIAFLPSYEKIGMAAPILLTFFRLLQGAAIGGEIPGAITFVSETATKMKTLACSIICLGLVVGILLGQMVNIILAHFLSAEHFLLYGWRIAFILGGLFGLWGFYLRKKLVETPFFEAIEKVKVKTPILTVLKMHWKEVLIAWALLGLVSSGIMVLFLIMPSYQVIAGLSAASVFSINTLVLFSISLASLFFGYMGDKINKKGMLCLASLVAICFCYTVFDHLLSHSLSLFLYGLFCLFSYGIAVALVPAILAESFPTEVRYTGVALVYNLSFASTGGLAPVIIFSLINKTNNMFIPAFYFIVAAFIALIGLMFKSKNAFS